jgi:translocation and assembly module TamB
VDVAHQETGDALGDAITGSLRINYVEDAPVEISNIALSGADFGLNGDVVIQGLENGFPTDLDIEVAAQELARFAGLVGQPIAGAAELSVAGRIVPLSSIFDLQVSGTARDIAVEIPEVDRLLAGQTDLSLAAVRDETGTFVRGLVLRNPALDIAADVALRSTGSDVDARVDLADLGIVLPQYEGPVSLKAKALQSGQGWRVDADLTAPYDSRAVVSGLATGPEADLDFDLSVPEVQAYVPELQGPLLASGRFWQSDNGYRIDAKASGPFDAALDVVGVATGPEADLDFDLSVPEVQAYVPQVTGPLLANGRLWQSDEGYRIDAKASGPFNAAVDVVGVATGPDARIDFDASLPDLGVLVPNFGGAFALRGELARAGEEWALDSQLEGPAGLTADLAGTAAADGSTVDMTAVGTVPLGLAGPILAPSSIDGDAAFDLALKGAPSLEALSGTITTSNGRFSEPNLRIALQNIASRINLAKATAQLDVDADIANGGKVAVDGTLNLATLASDLALGLRNAVLVDPDLYVATLNADVGVAGPLTGGAKISGKINLEEVNVTVPGTGVTTIGAIPEITHLRAGSAITTTRARAGVLPPPETTDANGSEKAVFPLDLKIKAPSKIFVRGRGINAELGGNLEVTGTTANVVSAGSFDLIRGRIDIIGKRFDLTEGSVQFQGSATPYILFVTTTEIPDGTASITVEGPADEPEVTFSADPEAPEDEVMSLILFGRYVSELSAFQALQLANGVAQLSGNGGVNVIGGLRDGIGLDELDVTTDEAGSTSVSAGKYITDNIYTDITNNTERGTDISVNIDLTKTLTGRATMAEDGNSSIGLFFERDY